MITIGAAGLSLAEIEAVATGGETLSLDPAAEGRVAAAHELLCSLAIERPVYGLSTGVGAKRSVAVQRDVDSCLRLWRSHALGSGEQAGEDRTRGMLAVRAVQVSRGGSGVSLPVARAFADAVSAPAASLPIVWHGSSIGTGDLAPLATAALHLHDSGAMQPAPSDGLPVMSSSALTLADAALTLRSIERTLLASVHINAAHIHALGGNLEHLSASALARQAQAVQDVAAAIRNRVQRPSGVAPARIQDPFALRLIPQSLGAVIAAWRNVSEETLRGINGAHENPLIDVPGRDVVHVGNFYTIALALSVQQLLGAISNEAALMVNRLTMLLDGSVTGAPDFLTDGTPDATGAMMLEYAAASALAEIRAACGTAASHGIHISRGVEEHAPFTPMLVRELGRVDRAFATIQAALLLAQARLWISRGELTSSAARHLTQTYTPDPDLSDRDLTWDLAEATRALAAIATSGDTALVQGGKQPW
ncbi:aromatic amino acid lyase [Leucobacter luti]|uniref:aromatic amino acid lyase n=1 Tax=Leucobacter luti TaxID=340320 RepID=UPI001C68E999|nr:aromatic amino acid lyase [Leucobacter luti]QYM76320.1 aromatic amino acid lyase [Leucobacter luti]